MATQQQEKNNHQENSGFVYLQRGLKYGLVALGVSLLMGGIYGAFNLAPLRPALVVASFAGIFVVLNLLLALVLLLAWLIVYLITRKSYLIPKYFMISAGFGVVFLSFFALLRVMHWYYY